jgi:FtsH-binding integral membrane protein
MKNKDFNNNSLTNIFLIIATLHIVSAIIYTIRNNVVDSRDSMMFALLYLILSYLDNIFCKLDKIKE